MREQLGLDFDSRQSAPRFVCFVAARPGEPEVEPLDVAAETAHEAQRVAAEKVGAHSDRVLALPVRDGSWSDRLVAKLEAANKRAEADIQDLREMHAEILGCPVDELDTKVAEREAEEKRLRDEVRVSRPSPESAKAVARSKGKANGAAPASEQPKSALTQRQRELLGVVVVVDNEARFASEERIPDWPALKVVLTTLGGTWNKKKQAFVFPPDIDAAARVATAIETGEILDKRAAGFFETPEPLAARVVAACVRPGDRSLESSAGMGRIARAARDAGAVVSCFELLDDNRGALTEQGFELLGRDFLLTSPTDFEPFDSAPMNPPFARGADIDHVTHALAFLRPGGRLAAIMSAGVEFRQDAKAQAFRDLVAANDGTIERLPDGSFLESGTGVRTVLVTMAKA